MDSRHQIALDLVLNWINKQFQPVGIIVSGTIVRGTPGPASDFDIFVLRANGHRQRIQKYFGEVPCEIFVNSFRHVYDYFETEFRQNRPVTAHMIATGRVVLGQDDARIVELIEAAQRYVNRAADLTEGKIVSIHYQMATLLEDAGDIKDTDPATCCYLLDKLIGEVIESVFLLHRMPLPRAKERIDRLKEAFPEIGEGVVGYYREKELDGKFEWARQLIKRIVGKEGFFEWESDPE